MRILKDIIENRTAKQKIMIVTGPYNSGKTQFISTFNGKAADEVDTSFYTRPNYTEWRDTEGKLQITHYTTSTHIGIIPLPDEGSLYLLEWQGARRSDFLIDRAGDFFQGGIIVVDASKPEMFREAACIVETFRAYPEFAPPVIAVNRPDAPDARTLDDIRIALKLDEQHILMACDASRHEDTVEVVRKLADSMPETEYVKLLRAGLKTG